jgi:hypothetical protein
MREASAVTDMKFVILFPLISLFAKLLANCLRVMAIGSTDRHFQGETIYNDAASGLIWVENQVSLDANEMVMGRARFEQGLWDMAYAKDKHYHGNNGVFSVEEYRQECMDKGRLMSFSGVGAQHQNARAERPIQTILYMAC